MKRLTLGISIAASLTAATATAQQVTTVTDKADVTIAFDLSQPGTRFQPTWGLDQAWISEQNLRKGINHMGKENIGIGRACFRTTKALTDDSILAADQTNYLRRRAAIFNTVSTTLPLVLTADQEAGSDSYFVVNRNCDAAHWAANINSHVHWMQQNTRHPVVGVSPFNEPDYWTTEEGATVAKQVQVARLLRQQYPRMDTIAIVGGNTLNDDKALEWYTSGKAYYDWGNTHQLAGSFASFANFFQQLRKDGKVGYADEMHNVGEAMVGLEYGMTVGIWWGFDSRARGEFCDISRHGQRLAYGEHRNNWTAASVWLHDDGRAKAFIGSSERQALTTSYQFVSLDRDVYFDGQGPLRQLRIEIPGGTGYQKGQTNAERVVDIIWGDDVPPTSIATGQYKLVNKATGTVAAVSGTNVALQKYTGAKTQQWTLAPSDPRIGGDFSFYDITSVQNARTRMNLQDFSTADGANIMVYSQNTTPTSNEQWYLQYAADGYYYIRNRESALCLAASSSAQTNGVNVVQRTQQTADGAQRDRQLWRILTPETDYDTTPPARPEGLTALPLAAATQLTWTEADEADLDGYMVLRCEQGQEQWNTIARRVRPPYVDNTTLPARTYIYKVKAIDRAQNQSEPSAEVLLTTPGEPALVARWTMDGSLLDATGQGRHAAAALPAQASLFSADEHCQGDASVYLSAGQYLQLPHSLVQGQELTVSLWMKPLLANPWQRLFDFGYDTDHYLFLTLTNGSKMRFAIKNGGAEQTLDAPRPALRQWHHVVLTMKPGLTAIYVDGQPTAQTDAITISPADVQPVINYLGRSQFNDDPYFTGYLDDVRIYNHALSPADVTALYDEATAAVRPLTTDATSHPEAIYSPDGRRLPHPVRGLNIEGSRKVVRP